MTWMLSRSVASVVGAPLVTRTAVAAPDAADRAVAEHLVERGVHGGGDGPVAGGRVGDHRPDDHVARLGQDLAVDDVRLLPQDVAVERPDVVEPVALGPLRQSITRLAAASSATPLRTPYLYSALFVWWGLIPASFLDTVGEPHPTYRLGIEPGLSPTLFACYLLTAGLRVLPQPGGAECRASIPRR
jgi:hypothetical protein